MRDLSMIYPGDYYHELGGKLNIYNDNSEYKVFSSLEEWNHYPYKQEIIKQVEKLRKFMRKRSTRWWVRRRNAIGMYPKYPITPIFEDNSVNINSTVTNICKCINTGNDPSTFLKIPDKLVKSDLGYRVRDDLLRIKSFSNEVFCHTMLRYDSFLVFKDKLVGVINWEYAGYYPPEVDDVIYKYLDEL